MTDLIIVVILMLVVVGAGLYIYKAKKRGQTCIGCPYAKSCGKAENSCSNAKNLILIANYEFKRYSFCCAVLTFIKH